MSDLIKTGTQICQSHAWSEQFIVLSLLREKIESEKFCCYGCTGKLLSLLEEK